MPVVVGMGALMSGIRPYASIRGILGLCRGTSIGPTSIHGRKKRRLGSYITNVKRAGQPGKRAKRHNGSWRQSVCITVSVKVWYLIVNPGPRIVGLNRGLGPRDRHWA